MSPITARWEEQSIYAVHEMAVVLHGGDECRVVATDYDGDRVRLLLKRGYKSRWEDFASGDKIRVKVFS